MKFSGNFAFGLSLSAAMLIVGNGMAEAQTQRIIQIGTGGPTGVYFSAGNAICRMVNTKAKRVTHRGRFVNLRCSAPSTDGSIFNIGKIKEGVLDFGIVQSDWQYHAYRGSSKFRGKKFDNLRAVFSIHPEPFHLIVGLSTKIRRWSDLKGKRVNVGDPGSGHRGTMEALMRAHGISFKDFGRVT
jgi:TRAP transporter TAXI family solute receptor